MNNSIFGNIHLIFYIIIAKYLYILCGNENENENIFGNLFLSEFIAFKKFSSISPCDILAIKLLSIATPLPLTKTNRVRDVRPHKDPQVFEVDKNHGT